MKFSYTVLLLFTPFLYTGLAYAQAATQYPTLELFISKEEEAELEGLIQRNQGYQSSTSSQKVGKKDIRKLLMAGLSTAIVSEFNELKGWLQDNAYQVDLIRIDPRGKIAGSIGSYIDDRALDNNGVDHSRWVELKEAISKDRIRKDQFGYFIIPKKDNHHEQFLKNFFNEIGDENPELDIAKVYLVLLSREQKKSLRDLKLTFPADSMSFKEFIGYLKQTECPTLINNINRIPWFKQQFPAKQHSTYTSSEELINWLRELINKNNDYIEQLGGISLMLNEQTEKNKKSSNITQEGSATHKYIIILLVGIVGYMLYKYTLSTTDGETAQQNPRDHTLAALQ